MDEIDPEVRAGGENASVFLSYSRDDIAFVERLHAVLEAKGIKAHLDRHDIEKGEDWWQRLQQLITASDAIVFVLSPSSASSDVCRREVEFAASLNKRLIPLVMRDLGEIQPPEDLKRLNYIFFTPQERAGASGDFDGASGELVIAINTDLVWIREHTRIGGLALRWRELTEAVLRGTELDLAETWLSSHPKDAPQPTALTIRFITESRRAATRRLRRGIGIATAVTVGSLALAVFASVQWNRAEEEARTALSRQLASQSNAMSATDFGGALRVAATAFELEDNLETRGALLAATSGNPHTIAMLGGEVEITKVVASPTEPYVALGQNDGLVQIWNVATQSSAETLDMDLGGRISAIAFGRDPSYLAVADDTGQRIVAHGSETRTTLPPQDAGWVTFDFAFNPRATLLAEASRGPDGYSEVLRLWDISGQPHLFGTIDADDLVHIEHMSFRSDDELHFVNWGNQLEVSFQSGLVSEVARHIKSNRPGPSAYGASGNLGVASGFDTGAFFVFNAVTEDDIGEGVVAAAPIDAIAISHDDSRIAIAQERQLQVFDTQGGLLKTFDMGLSKADMLVFTSNAEVLIALSPSYQAHVFDLSASHRLAREIAPYVEMPSVVQGVMDAAFSPDGRYLGWIGWTEVDQSWNFSVIDLDEDTMQSHALDPDPLFEIAFLTDTSAVVSGATGTELAVDLSTGTIEQTLRCSGRYVSSVWRSNESMPLLFERCTLDSGYETLDLTDQSENGAYVQAASLSSDGTQLVFLSSDNMLHLRDFASGNTAALDTREILGGRAPGALAAVRLSPDGQTIALGVYNDVMALFRIQDLYSSGRFGSGAHDQIPSWTDFTFSPSSSYLAVERGNGRIGLWDARQARFLAEIESDPDVPARHLVFDPKDRYIAEARPGGGMVLWSVDPQRWLDVACSLAGRALSQQERRALMSGSKYADELTACAAE